MVAWALSIALCKAWQLQSSKRRKSEGQRGRRAFQEAVGRMQRGSRAVSSCFVALTEVLTSSGQPVHEEAGLGKNRSCSVSRDWKLAACGLCQPHSHSPGPAGLLLPPCLGTSSLHAAPQLTQQGHYTAHSLQTPKDNSVPAQFRDTWLKLVSQQMPLYSGRVRGLDIQRA